MSTAYCFDLDGTVTRDEVLPEIAREAGLFDEISALTSATVSGVIPFDQSFKLRCRLLQDVPVSRVSRVVERIPVYAEIAAFIKSRPRQSFIVTGNLDVWVSSLVSRLGCTLFSSVASVADDRLLGISSILDKGAVVREVRREFHRIVAVGDGMGDVSMFEQADVSIAFGGTHFPIASLLESSQYVAMEEGSLCRLLTTL